MQKNMSLNPLQAYISMHFLQCCSLYIPCGTCEENLSNNPELLKKTIISFILVILMFMLIGDAVGSIRCLLLLVVKGLNSCKGGYVMTELSQSQKMIYLNMTYTLCF